MTDAFPDIYKPDAVGTLYAPDLQQAYAAGQAMAHIAPAADDAQKTLLLLVDAQVDFVFPAPVGKLPVPNAVEDTQRTIEWLYRNLKRVTHITYSLDTHVPQQIFYPTWWRDADGQPPAPYTLIPAEDVKAGKWVPQYDAEWSVQYVEKLEGSAKKQLMIWPFHTMQGTPGQGLVPALAEALMLHSGARRTQPTPVIKGLIPHTEFYSAVEPEVDYPGHPDSKVNQALLDQIKAHDRVYIAGQARSHCVLATLTSFISHLSDTPEHIAKLHLIDDASSPISGFEESTQLALDGFAGLGLKRVKAADALE